MNRGEAKIRVQRVSREFVSRTGRQLVLDDIDFAVAEGEFLCILGPSGCGKSTLLHLMAGFDRPTRGAVKVDGRELRGPDPRYVAIFQQYGLFPWRNLLQNVAYGLEVRGVPKRERMRRAEEYLRLVGLEAFAGYRPTEVSGGMQQRVALARALVVEPEVLYLDEPFGALDAMTRLRLQREMERLWRQSGCTVVLVTHDIDEAITLGDRILLMSAHPGRIRSEIRIPLERPRNPNDPRFGRIREEILRELALEADLDSAHR
ncbi:MAG: ABC transporter ATP-binding protein, partial [Alicyclobacillaceae bacterium]|nr:ABC transporter ATP-binding protein [Alicyclobacillaceae bacterium]